MKYIYWAFVHAIWAYLYIGHTLLGQRKGGVTPPDFVFPILVVLAVSISACIHVNFKVRPFLLKCFYKSSSETGNKTQDPILLYGIILWAFCDVIAIYGLVWIMLGGSYPIQIGFTLLSLWALWLCSPKAIIEQTKNSPSKIGS